MNFCGCVKLCTFVPSYQSVPHKISLIRYDQILRGLLHCQRVQKRRKYELCLNNYVKIFIISRTFIYAQRLHASSWNTILSEADFIPVPQKGQPFASFINSHRISDIFVEISLHSINILVIDESVSDQALGCLTKLKSAHVTSIQMLTFKGQSGSIKFASIHYAITT